jgi:hypothetical protein
MIRWHPARLAAETVSWPSARIRAALRLRPPGRFAMRRNRLFNPPIVTAALWLSVSFIPAQPAQAASGAGRLAATRSTAGSQRVASHVLKPLSLKPLSSSRAGGDTLIGKAQTLESQLRSPASDIAGITVNPARKIINVYRTNTARELPPAIASGGVTVRVHRALFSHQEMMRSIGRLINDAAALATAGIRIQALGPAPDGRGLVVSVFTRQPISRATRTLRLRYGSMISSVHASKSLFKTRPFFAGPRFNDTLPWYGGDRLNGAEGCSSGFGTIYHDGSHSSYALLTAAHCGGLGTAFFNGPTASGAQDYVGSSVYRDPVADISAVAVTSSAPWVWVSNVESDNVLNVEGWESPVTGETLCQSGSYTGEVCGLKVVDTDVYECYAQINESICNGPFSDVINTAGPGSYAGGHGDSGGPVYRRAPGFARAVGLVDGPLSLIAQRDYPAYFPTDLYCPAPEGRLPRCASGFSFAQMPGY